MKNAATTTKGHRYMKKVTQNGTVTSQERYLYRGYLQIAALDMLNSKNVLRTLLWDPLEPVATRPLALVQDNNALYCYGTDFNKNVTEVFDAQGTIAAAYDYSPYGQVASAGTLVQPVQWSSEMNDEELELVYYNYRYYNPADGRWINRDPIAEEGGWNLYAFIGNNSIKKKDIVGLISDSVTDIIIAYGAQGMSPKAISDLLVLLLKVNQEHVLIMFPLHVPIILVQEIIGIGGNLKCIKIRKLANVMKKS